jgi:phenylalanyl-tRNA synthetase alpha chain
MPQPLSLDQLEQTALATLSAVVDGPGLEAWRIEFLGSKGKIKAAMGGIKDVPGPEKPAFGARLNAVSKVLEEAFAARQLALGSSAVRDAGPQLDLTEPGSVVSHATGRGHIISRVREELVEVFARMGFAVAEGPELEDDEHNFIKLNIPPGHPAREATDNFYIDEPAVAGGKARAPRMLRSQTSTVQARVMQARVAEGGGQLREPIKIVSPGRVYRPDTVDATHSFMFHQIEGLCIDRGASMVDLKATLLHFARAYFGSEAEIRLRPTFFPFTEPSAELDLKVRLRPDQPVRWMELGGCGMVHPNVLTSCGIDPQQWQGYAFGFGIERLAMGKYAIPDIRMLYANDLRFLQQL